MTIAEGLRLLGKLAAAFPNVELRDRTLQVYAEMLTDLEVEVAEQAIDAVIARSRSWPAVATIRLEAAEIILDAPPLMEGWAQASRDEGRHPLVIEARKVVGDAWAWRSGDASDLRPAFIAAYRDLRDQRIREIQVGKSPTMKALPVTDRMLPRPPTDEV